MANQITVTSGTGNITITTSRSVIGTVANVASANLANYVIQNSQPNITSVGTMIGLTSSGNITAPFFIGNVVGNISGNFTIPGSNTSVIYNYQGNAAASDAFQFNEDSNVLTVNGNIAANYYTGNGSQLTGIIATDSNHANYANIANTANSVAGANVTGYVANATHANIADVANSVAVANVSGLGNIAVLNLTGSTSNILYGNGVFAPITVSGDANYANYAGNVVNASQPNITSVGTLTSLTVSGNITPTSNLTYSLGNNTNRFNDLYLSGNTIYLGAQEISANSTGISFTGNLSGNATGLSNIPGGNVTGQVNYAATANAVAGANVSGAVAYATTANAVAGANVSGAVAYATTANAVAGANVSGQVGYAAVANSVALANVSGAGNIASINLDGNVSNLLTGAGTFVAIPAGGGSTSNISNGTSNVNIATSGGNVTTSVGGTPNVFVVTTTGANITGTLNVTANTTSNALQLRTSTGVTTANTGAMFWDATEQTVSLGMNNGVTQQIGLENYIIVKAASAITDGQVVMYTGSSSGDNVLGAPANVSVAGFRPSWVLGIATQNIALNGTGYITTFGHVHGLNTNAYNEGDLLFLSTTTPGAFTATEPTAPDWHVEVGTVVKKSGGAGVVQVAVRINDKVANLSDANITTPTAGQALVFTSSNTWINGIPNIANIAYSVAGGNVSGQVANALVAGTVYTNAQPNITSTGNLTGLTLNNTIGTDPTLIFAPNGTSFTTNYAPSAGTTQVGQSSRSGTGTPANAVIRTRGTISSPLTVGTSDTVNFNTYYAYNGNTNALAASYSIRLGGSGTLNTGANAVYTGATHSWQTGNPWGDWSNISATSGLNTLGFNSQGSLSISPGARRTTGVNTGLLTLTDYGTPTGAEFASGIFQTKSRGNADSVLSVQPNDEVGRQIFNVNNGNATAAITSQILVKVDSSYTANSANVPMNILLEPTSNTNTRSTTTFYGNGTTSFPGLITTTGDANVGNINVTGNITPTGNITYDLGTSALRFKDIWLANSTIYIGSQTITANATNTNISGLITGNISADTANITGNVEMTGANVSLGNVANLKITGGSSSQVLSTDGAGNLSWVSAGGGGRLSGNATGNINMDTYNLQLRTYEETVYDAGILDGPGTIEFDAQNGTIQKYEFTGGAAKTVFAELMTNCTPGGSYTWIINNTGGAVEFGGSDFYWAGGDKTITTGGISIVSLFTPDGTTTFYASIVKGFAVV